MSDKSWKGAAAGMGYGFAFNDHLQALTAAAKAKMQLADAPASPAETAKQSSEPSPRRD